MSISPIISLPSERAKNAKFRDFRKLLYAAAAAKNRQMSIEDRRIDDGARATDCKQRSSFRMCIHSLLHFMIPFFLLEP